MPLARERVLYSFKAGSDGGSPQGTLSGGRSGVLFRLYGTTTFGGGTGCFGGCGTVFKLTERSDAYIESVLYRFIGGTDGQGPGSGVIADASGALYGTTEYGGDSAGDGIVFKLTPQGPKYVESVLYRFKGGMDGKSPLAGLTIDPAGNLYGATLIGGGSPACGSGRSGVNGCGVLFELRRSGSTYTERILHRFQSGSDGATPGSPPIFVGRDMYGTAATGGGNPSCGGAPINRGCGTVYKLTRGVRGGWTFKAIYAFTGTPRDAANPFAGLIAEKGGVLYGVG
ncbi:MAG TPA: choice-of-anchor tandem repeat GloVer-containing protein, partial [Candidatus Cybelea sp.]